MDIKLIVDKLIQTLFPLTCLNCNRLLPINSPDKWFCKSCRNKFKTVDKLYKTCDRCGRIIYHDGKCEMCNSGNARYDNGYVAFEYAGQIRECILKYKFGDMKSYKEYFSEIMIGCINKKADDFYNSYQKHNKNTNGDTSKDLNISDYYDCITCVPLHRFKKWKRGYNQTELIARYMSKRLNIPYMDTLTKVRNTKTQSSLSAKHRETNVKNAFKCKCDIKGKRILLIDDIITTGLTINECSKILKKAGATKVDFAVIACVNDD